MHLIQLFREYCKVKYQNIDTLMFHKYEGQHVDCSARDMLMELAKHLLLAGASSTRFESFKRLGAFNKACGPDVYRALMDEDVILEELSDPNSVKKGIPMIGFVYEAFMEFLMAEVLFASSRGRDSKLRPIIQMLIERRRQLPHVRGIVTFLLPIVATKNPKTFRLLCEYLEEFSSIDLVLPSLLNMWDHEWPSVEPIIRVAESHFPLIDVEQVYVFLNEWIEKKPGHDLLSSIQNNPRLYIKLLGRNLGKLLSKRVGSTEQVFPAALCLLGECSDQQLADSLLRRVFSADPALQWLTSQHAFGSLAESLSQTLFAIGSQRRWERNWQTLWFLARIGSNCGASDLLRTRQELLIPFVKSAAADSIVRADFSYEWELQWWCTNLQLADFELDIDAADNEPYVDQIRDEDGDPI